MTTHMKICFTAIAILLAGRPVVLASEPNDSNLPLEFKLQPEALGPFLSRYPADPALQAFASLKPAYAAGISLEDSVRHYIRPGRPTARQFVDFALRHAEISAAQKKFLKATSGLLHYESSYVTTRPRQLLLYAMTLEDAKEMAEACVRFAVEEWRREMDEYRERMAERKRQIADAEERLRELPKLIEGLERTLNGLKQEVPYRTDKEAVEAIAELDRMLNAAEVDIAGIRARIEAIQKQQRLTGETLPEASKLRAMFIEESIALQGAEAQKTMATQLHAEANRFLDLKESLANAVKEREELPGRVVTYQNQISHMLRQLEAAAGSEPFAGRGVTIYPVEWATEDGGN